MSQSATSSVEGRSSTATEAQPALLRLGSRMLILAGIVSVPIGLLTLVYPPSVDPALWGYPFDHGVAVAVAIGLVVAHLLKVPGFVALSRLDGAGPVTRWSMLAAGLGLAGVAACEAVSATLFGEPLTSQAAIDLNNGYGATSMLAALASMVGGAVIIRKKLLVGFGRWSVFLSGAFMVFVVTPALFTGRGPIAYIALIGWSLFFIWIGRALGRTLDS